MGFGWNPIGFCFKIFFTLMLRGLQQCLALNSEGVALLKFKSEINTDPFGAFSDWNSDHGNPCIWSGVHCVDGKVEMLDLKGLSLEGKLAPELGKLNYLKSLILLKNHFSGTVPKELGRLTKLELLDLRENNFTGRVPAEIGNMLSLKYLLLEENSFEDSNFLELRKSRIPFELQVDSSFSYAVMNRPGCVNRKFGNCIWHSNLKEWSKAGLLTLSIQGALTRILHALRLPSFNIGKKTLPNHEDNDYGNIPCTVQSPAQFGRRRLLDQSKNLEAATVNEEHEVLTVVPIARRSGSFHAVPAANEPLSKPSSPIESGPKNDASSNTSSQSIEHSQPSQNWWLYLIIGLLVLIVIICAAIIFWMWRKRGLVEAVRPWKTGISGQLQKAFVTGAPKLKREELEIACENFSNIIGTIGRFFIYKGTLSSGVEIAVASVAITSAKDWTKKSDMTFRKKIETLSRVNHKNFANMLAYCEEERPFTRMIVFEYAPNGCLSEHLHVKELGHLDWTSRMRIIMGTAYCLQYMHHDMNPPVAHSNLTSSSVFLTDDFAAKVAEVIFGKDDASPSISPIVSGQVDSMPFESPDSIDLEANVYSFGFLLIEIISGKLPYSKEHDNLVEKASQYLNDKQSISNMVDPTLKSFKSNELEIICDVIPECIKSDPKLRPTMKDVTSKLRSVIGITPEQATPGLSPLWWMELELLSEEAA